MPDNMGYDRAIVTFSPDGRLFQVEYAREAVKRGTTSLGLIFKEGVIIAAARPLGQLAVPNHGSDKIHQIDDHLGAAISGFIADGRVLIDAGRLKAQIHKLTYDEPLSVRGAVKEIADRMQLFTQYGGVRPYGVALLFGGIDENGPELFEIDPSSTFYNWKAQVIGRGGKESTKILSKGWKEGMSEEDALKLAVESLRAGEKNVKPSEVELVIITNDKFIKYNGDSGAKFLKKYW
ncbi:MAG: archaeal proteasome endopeptidase complex subunit alpha [Candidatus Aenigmarchaeota archaeon]|nr:archaeal proteasome endopeptidase complex subunit alpha [Candidatus Aenigmarchaeota archaeon]